MIMLSHARLYDHMIVWACDPQVTWSCEHRSTIMRLNVITGNSADDLRECFFFCKLFCKHWATALQSLGSSSAKFEFDWIYLLWMYVCSQSYLMMLKTMIIRHCHGTWPFRIKLKSAKPTAHRIDISKWNIQNKQMTTTKITKTHSV